LQVVDFEGAAGRYRYKCRVIPLQMSGYTVTNVGY